VNLSLKSLTVSVRKEEFLRALEAHQEPDAVAILMVKAHLGDTIQVSYEDFLKVSDNGRLWKSDHFE
jgi:hypothetical protein